MGEFQKGVDELKKRKAAKDAGIDSSDPAYADFSDGWDASHSDSPREDVKKNYPKGGDKKDKDAFRAGYASGAEDRTA